jgi:hypothetical protein
VTCRWEDNISMDVREIGFGGVDWIHLANGGFCEHSNENSGFRKDRKFLD